MGTHSAFIQFGDIRVFVDGIPDSCEHRWNGSSVFYTQKGKRIDWKTFPNWRSYTSSMRDPLIFEHQDRIGDPVVEHCSTCSKCGKEFDPYSDILGFHEF